MQRKFKCGTQYEIGLNRVDMLQGWLVGIEGELERMLAGRISGVKLVASVDAVASRSECGVC